MKVESLNRLLVKLIEAGRGQDQIYLRIDDGEEEIRAPFNVAMVPHGPSESVITFIGDRREGVWT